MFWWAHLRTTIKEQVAVLPIISPKKGSVGPSKKWWSPMGLNMIISVNPLIWSQPKRAVYMPQLGPQLDDDLGGSSGSVYVYKKQGSSLVLDQKLLAPAGKGSDYFGYKVALGSKNGTVLGAFGAYNYDANSTSNTGAVFIYDLVGGAKLIQSIYGNGQNNNGYQVLTDGEQVIAGGSSGSKWIQPKAECTVDGNCVCKRGFGGANCATPL